MTFDVHQKSFQSSAKFSPDKMSAWTAPLEEDGWIHIHNSIRAEMRSLIETFQAVKSRSGALQEWEIQCIQNLWKLHFLHIHTHHSDEDDILVPRLSKRFRYPEKYAADHDELVAKLNKISDMMRSFEIANTHTPSSSLERVLSELLDYEKIMLPHLKQEEDQCLPLMRAYFTPKEVNRLMQKMNAFAPKTLTGSFIVCMGIDHFRNTFMKQNDIPSFVWYLYFKRCAKSFVKNFEKPMEALRSGDIGMLMKSGKGRFRV